MVRILILLVSLVSGGLAAWLGFAASSLTEPAASNMVVAAPTEDILVAITEMQQGDRLGQQTLRWQAWPVAAMDPQFIRQSAGDDMVAELTGTMVRGRLAAGQPVRRDQIVEGGGGFLSATLPAGKRAVAIRVTAESTAGGFVLPDDRVDVIRTDTTSSTSRTILSNVKVLAIDQRFEARSGESEDTSDKVVVGKTATLELVPEQAERIYAAQATGLLSLALRSTADNDEPAVIVEPEPVEVPVVTGNAADEAPRMHTVRILGAGTVRLVETRDIRDGDTPARSLSASTTAGPSPVARPVSFQAGAS